MIRRILWGLVLLLVFQVPATVSLAQDDQQDLPMFRGNVARTGEMPGPGPGWTLGVEVIWSADLRNHASSPTVVDGVVFVAGDNLFGLDAATGGEWWSLYIGGLVRSLAIVNGVVYVSSHDGYLYAIGAAVPRLAAGTIVGIKEDAEVRATAAETGILRGTVRVSDQVLLTGGPENDWWPVQTAEDIKGWLHEEMLEAQFTQPTPAPTPEAGVSNQFMFDEIVFVNTADVNMRAEPSDDAGIVDVLQLGAELRVLDDQSADAETYTWWNVEVTLTGQGVGCLISFLTAEAH
jgi:hypothetical protein